MYNECKKGKLCNRDHSPEACKKGYLFYAQKMRNSVWKPPGFFIGPTGPSNGKPDPRPSFIPRPIQKVLTRPAQKVHHIKVEPPDPPDPDGNPA
jgi:hypothetical protein